MKKISSALPPLRTPDDTQTGTQLSAPGSETPQSGVTNVQPKAIMQRPPADNLRAALFSLQECGLSLTYEVTGSRFPKEGGWEPVMSLKATCSEQIDAEKARKILDALEAPAPRQMIIEALTMCAALTAQPKEDSGGAELRFHGMAARLAEWPGDVVLSALHHWPTRNKWFPTLSEIIAECDARMGNREEIITVANRMLRK